MIKEENLKFFINSLSNEQLGKVIRELITPSNILFSDSEKYIFDILKSEYQIITSKQENYKTAALKRWEKRKAGAIQKEKTQKEDLPKNATFKDYKKALTVNNNQNADYSTFYFSKVKQDLTPEQMDIIIKAEDIF